jgi:hypothetical protein
VIPDPQLPDVTAPLPGYAMPHPPGATGYLFNDGQGNLVFRPVNDAALVIDTVAFFDQGTPGSIEGLGAAWAAQAATNPPISPVVLAYWAGGVYLKTSGGESDDDWTNIVPGYDGLFLDCGEFV